jgi:excinuclease ABC subunit B
MSKKDRASVIERLEAEMKEAAKNLQFERAAELRDAILELKAQ